MATILMTLFRGRSQQNSTESFSEPVCTKKSRSPASVFSRMHGDLLSREVSS